jgi:alkylation response protein AidB-like acyl-CoA dehydrogenase
MDLSLTDEQEFLREAARGTLSRFKIIEAAREAQDKGLGELPDLWPAAREAGWAGLLISEEHGGAGLDVFDAMLVAEETGRVLAPVPFLGLVPATVRSGSRPGRRETWSRSGPSTVRARRARRPRRSPVRVTASR